MRRARNKPVAVLEVVFEGKKATVLIFEHQLELYRWVFTSTPLPGLPEPQFETGEKIFIRISDLGRMQGSIKITLNSGVRLRNDFWIIVRYVDRKKWVGTLDGITPRPLVTIEVLERWGRKE